MRLSRLSVGNHSSSLTQIVAGLKFAAESVSTSGWSPPSVWSQTSAPSDLSATVFRTKPSATHSAHTQWITRQGQRVCVWVCVLTIFIVSVSSQLVSSLKDHTSVLAWPRPHSLSVTHFRISKVHILRPSESHLKGFSEKWSLLLSELGGHIFSCFFELLRTSWTFCWLSMSKQSRTTQKDCW